MNASIRPVRYKPMVRRSDDVSAQTSGTLVLRTTSGTGSGRSASTMSSDSCSAACVGSRTFGDQSAEIVHQPQPIAGRQVLRIVVQPIRDVANGASRAPAAARRLAAATRASMAARSPRTSVHGNAT